MLPARSIGLSAFFHVMAVSLACVMLSNAVAWAGPHDAFLAGPWEITIRIGLEGKVLHFPISVPNESKAQALKQVLPIMGTSVKINFEHYVPDLAWEIRCVKEPKSGHAARLRIQGEQLDQTLWLQSRDSTRRIISSPIGGIEMKELLGVDRSAEFFEQLADKATVGILSLWEAQQESPIEMVVQPEKVVTLPKDQGTLSILEYMPHYSIDRESKEAFNQSDQPINPALKIRLEQKDVSYERWVWDRFSTHPHESPDFPLRVVFSNYYLGKTDGKYLFIVGDDQQARLLFYRDSIPVQEAIQLGRSYAFAQPGYGFSVEEIVRDAVVRNVWTNRSKRLMRPALIGTLDNGRVKKQVVLEFNKPYHFKTESGTLVLIYRQRTPAPGTTRSP
jgi:hypothetical protein